MINLSNYMSYSIKTLNKENERLSLQMSTGKIIDKGSDNSEVYSVDLAVKDKIRVYDGIQSQMTSTIAFNNSSDTTVGQIKTQTDDLKMALSKILGNDLLKSKSDRETNKSTLKGIRNIMLTLANSQVYGEYLFAGIDTTRKPIIGGDASDFDETGKVTFNGKEELRKIAVEPKTYRERGITAKDIFFNETKFQNGETPTFNRDDEIVDDTGHTWVIYHSRDSNDNLADDTKELRRKDDPTIKFDLDMVDPSKPYKGYTMKVSLPHDDDSNSTNVKTMTVKHNIFDDIQTAIMALDDKVYDYGNSDNDTTTSYIDGDPDNYSDILRNVSENVTKAIDTVSVAQAKLGNRNKTFDSASIRIQQKITHYTIYQQKTVGVDYARASMELKSLEITYQALFSTITKLNDLSLIKFMR